MVRATIVGLLPIFPPMSVLRESNKNGKVDEDTREAV